MTSAAVYVRISKDPGGERAGVKRQRDDCLRRARDRSWDVLNVHEDNDTSAYRGKRRPGFEALLQDVTQGRVGVVIAWALDRLQRNRRDELRLYEACQKAGVTLSLINGPEVDFTTAAGRFVADSLGSVARLEVELKSDRQKRAVQQAITEGRRIGGRRPFGYDADGMTVRPDEAEAIRQGYADVLAGVAIAAIARSWNSQGHRTGQGSPFAPYSVRMVLLNARNAGLRTHRGEVVMSEGQPVRAQWPALVSEDMWRAVHALLRNPARRSNPRAQAEQYLLTGVALCGVCGSPVHAGSNARRNIPGYRCRGSLGHVARMAKPIEEYVQAVVVERLSRPDATDLMREQSASPELLQEANALRARLDDIAVEFADGSLSASQLRAMTQRLNERIATIDAQLADYERASVLGPALKIPWDDLPLERRRAVIDLLMTVTIHPVGGGVRTFRPESVGIQWKSPV